MTDERATIHVSQRMKARFDDFKRRFPGHTDEQVLGYLLDAKLPACNDPLTDLGPIEQEIRRGMAEHGTDEDDVLTTVARTRQRIVAILEPTWTAPENATDEGALFYPDFSVDVRGWHLQTEEVRAVPAMADIPGGRVRLSGPAMRVILQGRALGRSASQTVLELASHAPEPYEAAQGLLAGLRDRVESGKLTSARKEALSFILQRMCDYIEAWRLGRRAIDRRPIGPHYAPRTVHELRRIEQQQYTLRAVALASMCRG